MRVDDAASDACKALCLGRGAAGRPAPQGRAWAEITRHVYRSPATQETRPKNVLTGILSNIC